MGSILSSNEPSDEPGTIQRSLAATRSFFSGMLSHSAIPQAEIACVTFSSVIVIF